MLKNRKIFTMRSPFRDRRKTEGGRSEKKVPKKSLSKKAALGNCGCFQRVSSEGGGTPKEIRESSKAPKTPQKEKRFFLFSALEEKTRNLPEMASMTGKNPPKNRKGSQKETPFKTSLEKSKKK